MRNSPTVSVIIPSYNHESFVGSAIESVLNSTFEDFELIVIDDGSSDRSAEVIQSFTDPRLRFYPQQNHGAHATMNRGVSLARARWISILNSDDLYDPLKLETHLRLHEEHPELEASVSRVQLISETGGPLGHKPGNLVSWYESEGKKLPEVCGSLFKSLLVDNHLLTTSGLFMDKTAFLDVGGFVPLRYTHDWYMFLTLAGRGRFHVIEEPLVSYRRHLTNTIYENADRVRVEASAVLEWNLSQAFSTGSPEIDPVKAFDLLGKNPTFCCDAALLFQAFRLTHGTGPEKVMPLLTNAAHPLCQTSVELVKRHEERKASKVQLEHCRAQLDGCRAQLDGCRAQLDEVLGSRSWRITAPLRYLFNLLARIHERLL